MTFVVRVEGRVVCVCAIERDEVAHPFPIRSTSLSSFILVWLCAQFSRIVKTFFFFVFFLFCVLLLFCYVKEKDEKASVHRESKSRPSFIDRVKDAPGNYNTWIVYLFNGSRDADWLSLSFFVLVPSRRRVLFPFRVHSSINTTTLQQLFLFDCILFFQR
jgi:hypothetical protein